MGQSIGVWGNFHLNLICRFLCVFTRSATAVKSFFNGIMSTTRANVVLKMLREFFLRFQCHVLTQCVSPACPCALARLISSHYWLRASVNRTNSTSHRCQKYPMMDKHDSPGPVCSRINYLVVRARRGIISLVYITGPAGKIGRGC